MKLSRSYATFYVTLFLYVAVIVVVDGLHGQGWWEYLKLLSLLPLWAALAANFHYSAIKSDAKLAKLESLGKQVSSTSESVEDLLSLLVKEKEGDAGHRLSRPKLGFEIYLEYRELSVEALSGLLHSVDRIHRIADGLLVEDPGSVRFSSDNSSGLKSFLGAVESRFQEQPERRLVLCYVRTGESIRLRFSPGWKPSLKFEDSELTVTAPKALAATLGVAYLLFVVAEKGISTANEAIDAVKKLKEIEKLDLEVEKLEKELEKAPIEVKEEFDRQLWWLNYRLRKDTDLGEVEIEVYREVEFDRDDT